MNRVACVLSKENRVLSLDLVDSGLVTRRSVITRCATGYLILSVSGSLLPGLSLTFLGGGSRVWHPRMSWFNLVDIKASRLILFGLHSQLSAATLLCDQSKPPAS